MDSRAVDTVNISSFEEIGKTLDLLNNKVINRRKVRLKAGSTIHRGRYDVILWKLIGLILTDGDLSDLLKRYRSISFGGLSRNTAIAVISTLIRIVDVLTVGVIYRDKSMYYRIYLPVSSSLKYLIHDIIYYINELEMNHIDILSNIRMKQLAALLAGIIDGDGYFGKSSTYISISFNSSSVKGEIINRIISFLQKQRYITLGKYYHKPKYEITFSFTNPEFAKKCLEYVYHAKRRKRMQNYVINYMRNYVCPFSASELREILNVASSMYINHRKPPRKSKVLVIYIYARDFNRISHLWGDGDLQPKPLPIHNGNRVMIKITEKCKQRLRKAVDNENTINNKFIKIIKEFIEMNKHD